MTEVAFVGMAVVDFLFEVEQIPMTAEKHRAEDISIVGGGCAATAAVAAARLGASARMIGRLGDDAVGDQIVEGLRAEGVDCAGLHRAIGAKSSCSSVLVDGAGERLIVNFRGEGLIETAEWIDIGAATAV
ncbi:MAG: PfkB family carbohydrate kinase, partial [Pseudomonadota bacterium]